MNKPLSPIALRIVLVLLIALLGGGGYYWWNYMDKEKAGSLADAMEVSRKAAEARGIKPNPNAKMLTPPAGQTPKAGTTPEKK